MNLSRQRRIEDYEAQFCWLTARLIFELQLKQDAARL